MIDPLSAETMDACLQLSRDAMVIFDALEADQITLDTARAVVSMGQRANDIALAVKTLVLTGRSVVRP